VTPIAIGLVGCGSETRIYAVRTGPGRPILV
jgi:hypothetical protein